MPNLPLANRGDQNMTGLHTARVRLLFIVTIIISVFLAYPVGADHYYQYTDDSGNIHFTDDPGNVPEDKRSGMIKHQAMQPNMPDSINKDGHRRDSANQTPAPAGATWDQNIKRKAASLDRERKVLHSQYEDILKKQQEVGEPPPSTASSSEIRRYKEQVEALNRRIEEYERRRKQFDGKVSEFRTGR